MSVSVLSLQLQFQQHLLGCGDAAEWLAGTPARRSLGLGIYANAYRLRLLDTLSDAYQKTQAAMGEAAFEAAAFGYITTHPPTTRSLRWYGGPFSTYLMTQYPEAPALAEMARLDWALRTAFDGPDSQVLDAAALGAIEPEAWATLRLVLVPTAERLTFSHNTVAVWQALDDDESPPPLAASSIEVDWLVWRKGLQPHFRSLHRVEAALLRAMLEGESFAQACTAAGSLASDLGHGDAEVSVLIGGFIQRWLEDQILASVAL